MALEPNDKIEIDIEDWQNIAINMGYGQAKIFAFPFLSDLYFYYPDVKFIDCNEWQNKGMFVKIPIERSKLDVLFAYGIRLVTRSEYYQNEEPFKGMKKYLDSKLFYVHSKSIELRSLTKEKLTLFLDKMTKNEWMVDFWCHNWNVAENPDKFEMFLETLSEYRNEIWITTLKEFWNKQELLLKL